MVKWSYIWVVLQLRDLSRNDGAPKLRLPVCMPQRILIADDNLVFRKTLRQLLEGADHWEVIEARDGREAVIKSAEIRPDVIILDLAMPDKGGLTAAREISQLLPTVPMLMCTMHPSPLVDAQARKSGIRRVFSKADSNLVVAAIRQLLNPGELERQVPETAASLSVQPNTVPVPLSSMPPTDVPPDPTPKLPKNVA